MLCARRPSVLYRGQSLQCWNIKIGMYFLPKGDTHVYYGGVLGDQLSAVGNHMSGMALCVYQGLWRQLIYLSYSAFPVLVRMQFEYELTVGSDLVNSWR